MTDEKQKLIELPEHMRPRDSEGARGVGREVVSRATSEGRYGTPPVPVEKTGGIPIDLVGRDALIRQARTFGDMTAPKERRTEHDPDEV